ncbi:MAG: hypothetical protein APF76_00895 [Desulfitibacter sp. BRH_c19]|nr:MAG: hypothetical protein APF76_00895 [Desulfitibacter sp. BRH_c19]
MVIKKEVSPRVLVTGATGYVGGRLIPYLLNQDYQVRCFIRNYEDVSSRNWQSVEIFKGDVFEPETLEKAMEGIDYAYYLIHSMAKGKDFHQRDLKAAHNFGGIAKKCGIKRIIYLSGLGSKDDKALSEHLHSRQKTGKVLAQYGVPVTEFRAAQIIGSGSVSFELVRYLTERLPIIIAPKWIKSWTQPIAIEDILYYLSTALKIPETAGQTIEIGGSTKLTYEELFRTYARSRNLKRRILILPFLPTRFLSYFVNFITPIPRNIATPLIEGLKNDVVVQNHTASKLFDHKPLSVQKSIDIALKEQRFNKIETHWAGTYYSIDNRHFSPVTLSQREGLFVKEISGLTWADPREVFQVIKCVGGSRGWPSYKFMWALRGLADQFLGGSGLQRGRRSQTSLRVGDQLDFFRVEALEEGQLLRLQVDFKIPGRGWLEFSLKPQHQGQTMCQDNWISSSMGKSITDTLGMSQSIGQYKLTLRAYFEPFGFFGLLYWKLMMPFHKPLFKSTIQRIIEEAEKSYLKKD